MHCLSGDALSKLGQAGLHVDLWRSGGVRDGYRRTGEAPITAALVEGERGGVAGVWCLTRSLLARFRCDKATHRHRRLHLKCYGGHRPRGSVT
jgi:hypothetical protein